MKVICIFFALVLLSSSYTLSEGERVCKAVVDIGFILDSSGSIKNDYQKEKDFLKQLSAAFGVKKGETHAGVVTFSYRAHFSIRLNKYADQKSFDAAVDKIPLYGLNTRIDKALFMAWKVLFNPRVGGRPNVPKLLVLITDGVQSPGASMPPEFVARQIRKAGIPLITVGVGSGVDRQKLNSYSPGNSYTAADFKQLLSGDFIGKVVKKMCAVEKAEIVHPCEKKSKGGCMHICNKKGAGSFCTCKTGFVLAEDKKACLKQHPCDTGDHGCQHTCQKAGSKFRCLCDAGYELKEDKKSCKRAVINHAKCHKVVDIGFILDSSLSVKDHYGKEKDFLKGLASTFGVSDHGTHIGVVTFSFFAFLSIPTNKYTDLQSFNAAVDRIRFYGRNTRIDRALITGWQKLLNPKFGARPAVPKLLVLITDGVQSPGASLPPAKIAQQIRAAGISFIAVGVGSDVSFEQLNSLSPGQVYTAKNFKDLLSPEFKSKVTKTMCHDVTPSCKPGYQLDKDLKSCFRKPLPACPHAKAVSKVGCLFQYLSPMCNSRMLSNMRKKFDTTWIPASKAKENVEEVICKCSAAAVAKGHVYFSIRNYGECMTGNNTDRLRWIASKPRYLAKSGKCFSGDGKWGACNNNDNSFCVGGPNYDYVYLIKDNCAIKNGGCGHHCDNKGFGVTCSCRVGYVLAADKKTCRRK